MAELKPCPFCGENAILLTVSETFGLPLLFFVACCRCGVETKRTYRTKKEAISAWNRRAEGDK